MNSKHKNNRKSTKTNKKKNQKNKRGGQTTLVLPRRLTAMPDKFRTNLKYWKAEAIDLSSVGYLTTRYHGSGGFPDLSNPTKHPNMFAEVAAFYASYRIHGSRIMVELVNTSSNSVIQLTVLPVNIDPGSSPSADYNVDARLQSYAKSRMASSQGGPVTRIKSTMTTQRIYGNPMTKVDDNFAALINTNPINMWFWVISLYSLSTIPSAEPVLMNVFLDFDIEFYDRRAIVDTTLMLPPKSALLPTTKEETEPPINTIMESTPDPLIVEQNALPEDYKPASTACECKLHRPQ